MTLLDFVECRQADRCIAALIATEEDTAGCEVFLYDNEIMPLDRSLEVHEGIVDDVGVWRWNGRIRLS